jgi:serine/threonine-protein kinase
VSIPGTERANNPVFSPDGEWIAFVADGRLKKIRPGGGAAITLADSAGGPFGGPAWLDDGTVIYVAPNLSDLMRVSAAGGPSMVALRDPALAGFGIAGPRPLPHARGLLFTACASGCVTMNVQAYDLRTGRRHVLLEDAATAWYLPTRQLLYVRRDGAALVAPFDLDRLEITGAAVPVLEGVLVTEGYAQLAWSPAGTLAYLRGSGVDTEREVVRVGRNGAASPIDTAWHGGFNSLALAPDGQRLAVGAGLASGALGIWIKQLDRGPFTRLTFGGQDRRPAWSPDGRVVAFIRDSGNTGAVFARPADGSAPDRRLARIDRQIQEVTWSPDGRWLVVRTDNGSAGAGDLVGVHTTGDTAPVSLVASEFTELHPAISPDGRWLAYTSNESGTNEVYVRPFPATGSGRWQVSNGGGQVPVWARDGREIYFVDAPGNLVAARVRPGPAFEVAELRPLFDALGTFTLDTFHQLYDVLPGGRGFVFLRERRSGREAAAPAIVYAEDWLTDIEARIGR